MAIVDAILRLASSLGLTVVAEGVETEEQLERLRELGCSLVQGHLYGKAESADEHAAVPPPRAARRARGAFLSARQTTGGDIRGAR